MPSEYVLVLTTLPLESDGEAFGRALVDDRLAACVSLLPPMASVYRWQGSVTCERERQVVIKTTRTRVAALFDRVRQLHPYEVPELIVLDIADGAGSYLRWIGENTGTGSASE